MAEQSALQKAATKRALEQRWLLVALVFVVGVVLFGQALPQVGPAWYLTAILFLAWVLTVLWRHLDENEIDAWQPLTDGAPERATRTSAKEPSVLVARFGPGTTLTLLRALGLGIFAGYLVLPRPTGGGAWTPAALFAAIAIADGADGWLARRTGMPTRLGARLDLILDGWMILIGVLVCIAWGILPLWFVLVGAARYVYVAVERNRRRRGLPLHPLAPNGERRIVAGLQMAFLAVVLWPIIPSSMAHIAAWPFAVVLLSGFLRDGLVMAGRIPDVKQPRERRVAKGVRFVFRLARLLVALGLLWWLLPLWPDAPSGWSSVLETWPVADPEIAAPAIATFTIVAAVAFALAWTARAASVLLLPALVLAAGPAPPHAPTATVALVVALLVLLLDVRQSRRASTSS